MIDERLFNKETIYDACGRVLENQFYEFEEYLDENSTDLSYKQQRVRKMWNDPEVVEKYEMELSDGEYKYGKSFQKYMYNSLLLTMYGQFENWLRKICDLYSGSNLSKVKVSDLSGGGYIDRCRKYLELIGEFDLGPLEEEWKKIVLIQKLRNCIAHNNSNIIKDISQPLKSYELYKLLEKEGRITVDKEMGNFYINDKNFLLDGMATMLAYARGIVDRIDAQKVLIKSLHHPVVDSDKGVENVEKVLESMFFWLNELDEMGKRDGNEQRVRELRRKTSDMVEELLKLYAFFCGAECRKEDVWYILREREAGLLKIRSIYK